MITICICSEDFYYIILKYQAVINFKDHVITFFFHKDHARSGHGQQQGVRFHQLRLVRRFGRGHGGDERPASVQPTHHHFLRFQEGRQGRKARRSGRFVVVLSCCYKQELKNL